MNPAANLLSIRRFVANRNGLGRRRKGTCFCQYTTGGTASQDWAKWRIKTWAEKSSQRTSVSLRHTFLERLDNLTGTSDLAPIACNDAKQRNWWQLWALGCPDAFTNSKVCMQHLAKWTCLNILYPKIRWLINANHKTNLIQSVISRYASCWSMLTNPYIIHPIHEWFYIVI